MEDAKHESGKKGISCYLNIDIQESIPNNWFKDLVIHRICHITSFG